ncbi:MAG TPA: hypothetical protein VK390_07360 [Propionibacteriaceae bacterium]|nr:hypothetical protein [Propionibacteriaceae bacterium]
MAKVIRAEQEQAEHTGKSKERAIDPEERLNAQHIHSQAPERQGQQSHGDPAHGKQGKDATAPGPASE